MCNFPARANTKQIKKTDKPKKAEVITITSESEQEAHKKLPVSYHSNSGGSDDDDDDDNEEGMPKKRKRSAIILKISKKKIRMGRCMDPALNEVDEGEFFI